MCLFFLPLRSAHSRLTPGTAIIWKARKIVWPEITKQLTRDNPKVGKNWVKFSYDGYDIKA